MDFTFGGFITGAAAIALIGSIVNFYWEHRKLSRDERAKAYATFLSVFSQRWRAFGDRNGVKKRLGVDSDEYRALSVRVDTLRDELWEAYTRIEILGPHKVVARALYCVGVSDAAHHAHVAGKSVRGVPVDEKAEALRLFVAAARYDVGQNKLKLADLRAKSALAHKGRHVVDEVLVPSETDGDVLSE